MTSLKQSLIIVSVALLVVVSFCAPARAQTPAINLSYFGVESVIKEDLSISNKVILKFNQPVNHFNYEVNFPVYNLRTSSNFEFADCLINNREDSAIISCDFIGMNDTRNSLTLEFDTRNRVRIEDENYKITIDYSLKVPVQASFVMIKLPENSILASENQSYFPVDGKTLTDGRRIMVYWEREPVSPGQLQFSITYNTPNVGGAFFSFILAALVFIALVAMIAAAVYIRRGKSSADVVRSVLNADEKKLVDILTAHDGKAGQKILVRESDFSKAKVSRIVSSLKSRGVVSTEPISGRENRVMLVIERKKKENGNEQHKKE